MRRPVTLPHTTASNHKGPSSLTQILKPARHRGEKMHPTLQVSFLLAALTPIHSFVVVGWARPKLFSRKSALSPGSELNLLRTNPLMSPIFTRKTSFALRTASEASERAAVSQETIRLAKLLSGRPFFDVGTVGGSTCAQAFREKRHLSDVELDALRVSSLHDDYDDDGAPFSARRRVVEILRAKEEEIVGGARLIVLDRFPGIIGPGGGLYPASRSEACWKDFCTFLQPITTCILRIRMIEADTALQCVSYATAADVTSFTNAEGAALMQQLYTELKVPLDAMVVGVTALRDLSHERVQAAAAAGGEAGGERSGALRGWSVAEGAFDHLINVLEKF